MAIFSTSVALLLNKITEKTVKTVILSLLYNTKKLTDFCSKPQEKPPHTCLIFKHFNKSQLCDVITVIFVISYAALSRLPFFKNILQFDISCSSAHDIVWDC